jgi:hypothetical protein
MARECPKPIKATCAFPDTYPGLRAEITFSERFCLKPPPRFQSGTNDSK